MRVNGNFWKYVSIGVHLTSECEKKEEGSSLFYQVLLCLMK